MTDVDLRLSVNPDHVKRPAPPVPGSVSEQARRMLATPLGADPMSYPDPEDIEGWVAFVAAIDNMLRPHYESLLPPSDSYTLSREDIGDVVNFVIKPTHIHDEDAPIFIEIHGGALCLGGGDAAWMASAAAAIGRDGVTWAPDYRMPPVHPFPAALEDLLVVYRAALEAVGPQRVVVSGLSAGGNLAAALLIRAKDEGLPMPAALVLLTPEVDLTESGDTFVTNDGIDNVLSSLMPINVMYAAGEDLSHPYISPLFADVTGFPPTLLQSGTRDLFLSNTVRMHRNLLHAGVTAELHVFEAMPHGGFTGAAPEDAELRAEVRRFEAVQLAQAAIDSEMTLAE